MKNFVVVIIISLIIAFTVYSLQNEESATIAVKDKFENVNKIVKVDWSNVGSWIFLYDPSIDDYESSVILEISFHRELEDMGRGGGKAYVVESLIKLVNSKFDKKIKLVQFKNNGKILELVYQNGIWIIWDYANKKEPTKVKKG